MSLGMLCEEVVRGNRRFSWLSLVTSQSISEGHVEETSEHYGSCHSHVRFYGDTGDHATEDVFVSSRPPDIESPNG